MYGPCVKSCWRHRHAARPTCGFSLGNSDVPLRAVRAGLVTLRISGWPLFAGMRRAEPCLSRLLATCARVAATTFATSSLKKCGVRVPRPCCTEPASAKLVNPPLHGGLCSARQEGPGPRRPGTGMLDAGSGAKPSGGRAQCLAGWR